MSSAREHIKVLSTQVQCCALQEQQARQRLRAGRSRFFGNPTNLLLPFCTGMLVAAHFSGRASPPDQQQANTTARGPGGKVAWFSVMVNAVSSAYRFYTRHLASEPIAQPAPQPASGGAARVPDRSPDASSAEAPGASFNAP